MSRNRRLAEIFLPKGLPKGIKWGYTAVYAIVGAIAVYFSFVKPYATTTWDTAGYFTAFDTLASGRLDLWRTPVYPIVIGAIRAIAAPYELRAVEVVQWIVFFLSIPAMRLAATRVIGERHHTAVFAATALYTLCPSILAYNDFILTESLSVSGSVFFAASLLKGLRLDRPGSMLRAMLWLLALIMLRPLFVCYLPVMAVVIVGYRLQGGARVRRAFRSALLGFAVCIGVLGGYVAVMYHTYGITSLSIVNSLNNYYIFRRNGVVTPESASNPVVKAAIERHFVENARFEQIWAEELNILDDVGPAVFADYIGELMANHRQTIVDVWSFRLFYKSTYYALSHDAQMTCRFDRPKPPFIPLCDGMVFLILTLTALCCLWGWRRRVNPGVLFVGGAPLVLMVSSLIGAQDEYSRLSLPGIPLIILYIIYLTDRIWHGFLRLRAR